LPTLPPGYAAYTYEVVDFTGKMSFIWEYNFFNQSLGTLGKKAVEYRLSLVRERSGIISILETRDFEIPKTGGGGGKRTEVLDTFTSESVEVQDGDNYVFTAVLLTSTTVNHYTGMRGNNIFSNKVFKTLTEGAQIRMSDVMPDILQTDLISSLRTAFNLYFITDEIGKTIYIEPRDSFYTGDAVDWSDKVDLSKPIEISHMGANLSKKIRFRYAEDSNDKFVKLKEEELKQGNPWLSIEVDNSNKSAKDGVTDRSIKSFGPTYMGNGMDSAVSARIPRIWGVESNPEKRIEKWVPRLLYYRGPVGLPAGEKYTFEGVDYSSYPQFATNYIDFSGGSFTHQNTLDWNDNGYGYGLKSRYYENTIDTINDSRKFSIHIKLNAVDILNLNFRTPIYIEIEGDGHYFHLERINDYVPESAQSYKCDFIKVINPSPLVEKNLSPQDSFHHTPPVKDEELNEVTQPVLDPNFMVYTEKTWLSTTENPTGEWVDVYANMVMNKVSNSGVLTSEVRDVKIN
jgi:hypothetical protein